MTGEKDPRDVMQAEHDAGLSEHPAFRAPAEMPGEIERAFNLAARAMQRRFSASGTEEDIEAALSEFFAPILAEMREIANAQGQQRFANLLRADAAEARALAAEAALAAERERAEQLRATVRKAHVAMTMACALPGVASEYDFSEAIASTEATLARRAAAIRAQGAD